MSLTFYWHDYETWGADPARDRAAQFAGVRTDAELNIVGKPLNLYCKPADDVLPQPDACLVTRITPQKAQREGVNESEFFEAVHRQLAHPETCGIGYNSIRFDDEVTRYGFYRNFIDPYAREWQNGNSRWDLIDLVRVTRALRPEGISWPEHEPGVPSFRLEALTAANGLAHEGAHDALADVMATIELARLIRARQPRLFDYLFQMRSKQRAGELLNLKARRPVLHVSSMYPAARGCIAMVVPLLQHPVNKNGIIVYDLRYDPEAFLGLGEEELRSRLFTPREQLPEGDERLPVKTVHLNKSPVIVPLNTLTEQAAAEWGIDVVAGEHHRKKLEAADAWLSSVAAVHGARVFDPISDPDLALYGGGFFSHDDRRRMERVRNTPPTELPQLQLAFDDARLPEMLFRYRARNWPETLNGDERNRWDAFRRDRLTRKDGGASITLDQYRARLARLMVEPGMGHAQREILSELADWPGRLI